MRFGKKKPPALEVLSVETGGAQQEKRTPFRWAQKMGLSPTSNSNNCYGENPTCSGDRGLLAAQSERMTGYYDEMEEHDVENSFDSSEPLDSLDVVVEQDGADPEIEEEGEVEEAHFKGLERSSGIIALVKEGEDDPVVIADPFELPGSKTSPGMNRKLPNSLSPRNWTRKIVGAARLSPEKLRWPTFAEKGFQRVSSLEEDGCTAAIKGKDFSPGEKDSNQVHFPSLEREENDVDADVALDARCQDDNDKATASPRNWIHKFVEVASPDKVRDRKARESTPSLGKHQKGFCRMDSLGDDPPAQTSDTDEDARVENVGLQIHFPSLGGHDELKIIDSPVAICLDLDEDEFEDESPEGGVPVFRTSDTVGDTNGPGILTRAEQHGAVISEEALGEAEVVEAEVMSDDEMASPEGLSPKKVRAALSRLGRPLKQTFNRKSKEINGTDGSTNISESECIKHRRGWTKKIAKIATQSPKKSLAALKGRNNGRKMERLDSQDEIGDLGSFLKSLHVKVSAKEDGTVESPVSSSGTVEVDDIIGCDVEGIFLHMPDRDDRSTSDTDMRETAGDRIDACGSYTNDDEKYGLFTDQPEHRTCNGVVWVQSKSGCVQHLELDFN